MKKENQNTQIPKLNLAKSIDLEATQKKLQTQTSFIHKDISQF